MRVVLDPNVLISAVLSPTGAPAAVLDAWRSGSFELVVSALLLDELTRALAYPKLRRRVSADEASAFIERLAGFAIGVPDPDAYPLSIHSRDPEDDYLLALAASAGAILVSGDADLLELSEDMPIHSPASFLVLTEV